MEISHYNSRSLIIKDRPSMGRIIGYAISGVGIILMATNLQNIRLAFLFWAGLVLAAAGLAYQSFLREDTTCELDVASGKLTINRRMGFLRTQQERLTFDDISKIRIEVQDPKTKDKQTNKYRISLLTSGNKWIPITRKFLAKDLKEVEKVAGAIQSLLSQKAENQ